LSFDLELEIASIYGYISIRNSSVGSVVQQGYRIAPDLFLRPMDHMMERTVHRGMTSVTIGKEVFTDLDFADDVSLLAEMLEVLVLAFSH